MKLFLVRHGETSWNKEGIFRGRKDIQLNRNGVIQAKSIAKYLFHAQIDFIYSSPLKRALYTAKEITKYHKLNVQIAKELIDFDFGNWEGYTIEEIKKKFPELYNLWLTNPEKLEIPNGETIPILKKRLKTFLDYLIKKHPQKTIILVSHRVVLKMLILIALRLNTRYFWSIKLDTGSISILEYSSGNKFVLNRLNDVSHLKNYQNHLDF